MLTTNDISVMLFPWDQAKPRPHEVIEAAQVAESCDFYSVSLPMHMTLPPGWLFESFENKDCLDSMALLPAISQATSRIKIGLNSALLPLLPPFAWAKYLSTMDLLSDGRFIFGTAMGWWEEDFKAVGVSLKQRGSRFDEQLEIITKLCTEEAVDFSGTHYEISDLSLNPKPLQKPFPPIWIGGGEKSVERAARYGEYLLVFWPDESQVENFWIPRLSDAGKNHGTKPKLAAFTFAFVAKDEEELKLHRSLLELGVSFEEEAQNPESVTIAGSPEECAESLRKLHNAGVDHFVLEFQFHGVKDVAFSIEQMKRFRNLVLPLL